LCLMLGKGEYANSPGLMMGTFGAGQLATAFILYWSLERNHDPR
jgi:hypothetical protein